MAPVASATPKLPVIALSKEKLKPGTSDWDSKSKEVVHALEEYGAFLGLCDEFAAEIYDNLFTSLREVFELPQETKRKNVHEQKFFGYLGGGSTRPLYESLGMADPHTLEGAQHFTNTLWSAGNDRFCDSLLTYSKLVVEMRELAMRMVFDGYGVKNTDTLKSNIYELRMMRYRVPEIGETSFGAVTHTDKDVMTVLAQDEINGLEVETKDGQWILVEPPPHSFIFFAGEPLMAWSNDRIRATPHRVVIKGTSRITVGLFSYFRGVTEIPEEFIDEEHPPLYQPFSNMELLNYFGTPEGGKSSLHTLKRMCGVDV